MKKIIIFTLFLIFIPFFIVFFFNKNNVQEIKLEYINNKIVRVKRTKENIIEEIPLEEYVVGVVAGEMPISFEIEALKTQAVASRTYVLKKIEDNKNNEYDVDDTINFQVFLDEETLKEKWKDNYVVNINKIRTAVNETIDEYLVYDNKIIDALFFSTSNGYTEDSDLVFSKSLPYLRSVESSWDQKVSKAFNSEKTMSLQEFYERLSLSYNQEINIEITKRSKTNRILKITINNKEFTGREIYNRLGLRSTDFEISKLGNNVLIKTKGYGHGVGMSQYGAQGMALDNYKYQDILKHYYQNVEIKKLSI